MKKSKKKIGFIVGLSINTLLVIGLIVGDFVCAKYSSFITKTLCNSNTDFSSDEAQLALSSSDEAVQKISEEGIVLLKNKDNALPLKDNEKKINLFGYSSQENAFYYGGGGSSSVTVNEEKKISLQKGLESEGFSVNTELLDAYKAFKNTRKGFMLVEPKTDFYEKVGNNGKTLLENAKDFSNVAVVTISRFATEIQSGTVEIPFTQNKDGATDESRHYLELSVEEENLINLVSENFSKTIVLLNTGNQMELGFLNNEKISGALLINYPGQSGTKALAKILEGKVNPSGKLTDTYIYDVTENPSYPNALRNGDHIHYTEDIYVGYKWYETAAHENFFATKFSKTYDDVVQYPFGYGLSYSSFHQEIVSYDLSPSASSLQKGTDISVKVKVKNTSTIEGKDLIQLYYTAPYTKGGIEKSYVNLLAFKKTDSLKPGEEKEYALTFSSYDMASYDAYDKNKNGFAGYELEKGEYEIKLMQNAHTAYGDSNNKITLNCENHLLFKRDPKTKAIISNRFGKFDADGKYINDTAYANCPIDGSNAGKSIVYLSRNDFALTYPTVATDNRSITSVLDYATKYVETAAYAGQNKPTQGVKSDAPLLLATKEDGSKASLDDLKTGKGLKWNKDLLNKLGENYNASEWDTLLDQLSEDELQTFVEGSGYGNDAAETIGKPALVDLDGPAGFNDNGGLIGSEKKSSWTAFPNETLIGQTWSTQVAELMGMAYGQEGTATGVSGIYGPGVNLHRSAFNSRNFEYYSEDATLSGALANKVIEGAKEKGTYCFLKHFVLSEAGINARKLNVWLTEQNLRENYLKPFEKAVKGGANGIMSAFNRLGATWTGGNYALIQTILRKEWKFKGVVITDWCEGASDMTVNQGVHAGNDIWLNPRDDNRCDNGLNKSLDSSWVCARRSAHNLLYTICNTYYTAMNAGVDLGIKESAQVFRWWIPALAGINVLFVGLELFFAIALLLTLKKEKNLSLANNSIQSGDITDRSLRKERDDTKRKGAASALNNPSEK